ncbi:MerR family DNA-binding transcriptional regulator [Paenibacillus xerothermodurans]|uniref:MerR family DNA-binding transcriptional regulator n=1 Tax=Paenibacillus xerothermodurans TaxID=1977292 RepID=A0A2W1NW38_PAEXE|nr:MerR family DNA-binding transcriptional regulator [Paenibacillus xerothermodurans]
MTELSIGQLSAKASVNASTVRYYESVGLLPSPERKNGQRRYDERILFHVRSRYPIFDKCFRFILRLYHHIRKSALS